MISTEAEPADAVYAPDAGACACLPPVQPEDLSLELFTEGDLLHDAMLAAIAAAHREVLLETFVFGADEVGWRIAEGLAERARQGVSVRLHIDAVGSSRRMSSALANHLRENRVDVRWFHRWSWRRPLRYYRRNHRKLLVVDRREAFLGGFNIHRENSRRCYGARRWRDTHLRVRGELADQAATYFERLWDDALPCGPGPLPARAASIPGALLVATPSRRCRRRLVCIYESLLDEARRLVYLTTPYFGPGPALRRAICRAARRGVDVRLLVPRRGDPLVTGWVTRSAYAELLEAGVRIYEYLPRPLHAKTAVIDGEWSSVGSVNLDELSLFVNQELLLLARGAALAEDLRDAFLDDLRQAREIVLPAWRQRSSQERLLEQLGRAVRPLV